MLDEIKHIKGIHPGFILERELKKRKLSKSKFALSIQEYPQTLVAITKGKRRMNVVLARKIENALNIEEGYFMILQVFYDIAQLKNRNNTSPNLAVFRPALFWDTDINKIDWQKQKQAVIKRVMERGNENEIREIQKFYKLASLNNA